MTTWLTIALVGATTMIIKAAGPVALGGRELPRRLASAVELTGPALLSALVVTAVFAVPEGGGVVVDERAVGLAVAVGAVLLRAPLLVVVVAAAASTALARLWVGAA